MKINENTISNVLTVLIFILVGALLFNYFRSINKIDTGQTSSTATQIEEQIQAAMSVPEVVKAGLPAEYTIKAGDSLWNIAAEAYGTGFDWVQVYEANKTVIKDPDILQIGTKITLPKIEVEPIPYTVIKGDNLWNISLKVCNNAYIWAKIATDNQISTPNMIEPGLVLSIKCR